MYYYDEEGMSQETIEIAIAIVVLLVFGTIAIISCI
jgi:hypothetical protein